MNFDITWTITAIIAVISFLSPIFVALINNHHHAKMRKMELEHDEFLRKLDLQQQISIRQADIYYADKKKAFSEFLYHAGQYAFSKHHEQIYENLLSASQQALLFCNAANQELLQKFIEETDRLLGTGYSFDKRNEYSKFVSKVALALSRELESSKPVIDCEPRK